MDKITFGCMMRRMVIWNSDLGDKEIKNTIYPSVWILLKQ